MIDKDECGPLSPSKYILAKYRIQVNDSEEKDIFEDLNIVDTENQAHLHVGPIALEPNINGGKYRCNWATFWQVLCCCCVPCYQMNTFCISCCELCYDDCSTYITKKEEVSSLKCCFNSCCQIN